MATISTLAIRVITQHSEAISGLAATATAVAGLATEVVKSNSAVRASAAAQDAAAKAYNATAGEVAKFTGKLIGVATAAAAASKAIQMSATEGMHKAYDRLGAAVERAFKAFGEAFNKSAGLTQLLDAMTAAVNHSVGVIAALGHYLGVLFGWLTSCAPLVIAFMVVVKALTAAVIFLVQMALVRWIVAKVTLIFLHQALTPLQLALAASTYLLSAAYGVATVAVWLFNAAVAALMLVGLPLWAAIAVVVLVVAAAIGLVIGLVYGLVKAWEWFTSDSEEEKKIKKLEELQSKLEGLSQAAGKMTDDVFKAIEQFGMDEIQKKVDDFVRANQDLRRQEGEVAFAERVEVYQQALEKLKDMKAQEKAVEDAAKAANEAFKERQKLLAETVAMQDDLNTKLEQVGMTEQAKALDDFVAKLDQANLLTDKQRDAAIAQYDATLQQIAAAEKKLKIEEAIANLQKEAAQAGMTEAQRKIADLQAMGATADQIAAAQRAIAQKDAAEEKAKLAERGKQLKESLATPAEEYKKKINEIGRLLAQGAIDPVTAMRAADAAGKALDDATRVAGSGREFASPAALLKGSAEAALAEDRNKTPFDRMTELQRKQLAEQQKLNATARDQLAAQLKGGKVVNIP